MIVREVRFHLTLHLWDHFVIPINPWQYTVFPSCVLNVLKKIACLQSCDDDVHVCLFPCNHVMRKKLVRLEMVRRSLRMRADIRIMKHLVTCPTSKVSPIFYYVLLSPANRFQLLICYVYVPFGWSGSVICWESWAYLQARRHAWLIPLPSWLFSRNWAVSEFNLFYYFFDPGAKEVDCLF